ncbi:hypothetical protein W97_00156 [Coniosporium apollinis CBS 100218]|uniref:Tautomerase cis-CaaD-like domain-containing protein n=1 Tax=Coniosporium apollinis (strain CBS 100218) TaxID=1168221 RepID=R7YH11_CONA1|nr:uncharacterized protein W97_00156 [Coniosporium apollinis CBS 100218]EON60946.1 hypothetical protein W97_00156 [Coniosporium apollinis CBS 100218]
MPLYLITLCHPYLLTTSQRRSLAQSITRIHSTLFSAPSLFVNVRFMNADAASSSEATAFVGGKESPTNSIAAHVRHGPSRPRSKYDELCAQIHSAWDEIVVDVQGKAASEEHKLHTIFVMGDIVAAWEQGFNIPEAGGDAAWIKENMREFERRAGQGDGAMRDLVEEVRARGGEWGIE